MSTSAYERILVQSAAFLDPNWFPPEDVCPVLADLRADHVRLLAVTKEKLTALGALQRQRQTAEEASADALRAAFLTGQEPNGALPDAPADSEIADAVHEYEVACEALEELVQRALREIVAREPQIRETLHEASAAAEAKRAEARRLLEEAERLASAPRRLMHWTDRYTGRSFLGPIAWTHLGDVVPEPLPEFVGELARLTPQGVIPVNSNDLFNDEMEDNDNV